MTKDASPFRVFDLDKLMGSQPAGLAPQASEEHLEALLSPERWLLRPPTYKYPTMPLKHRPTGNLAVLAYVRGVYRFVPKLLFEISSKDLETGKIVDPAELHSDGWHGD
jgi:hypothetical protein